MRLHIMNIVLVLLCKTTANNCIVSPLGFMNKNLHVSLKYLQLTFIKYMNTSPHLIIL